MSPRRSVPAGLLAVALAVSLPTLPASAGDVATRSTSSQPAPSAVTSTTGPSAVTVQMRQEIDRVVSAGRAPAARYAGTSSPTDLVRSEVRCADLDGQNYCLHSGWTVEAPTTVVDDLALEATRSTARRTSAESTGGLELVDALRRHAALSPAAQAAAERAELVEAARSVAKVQLIRHEVEGMALPSGFLARHPEVRRTSTTSRTTSSTAKSNADYPERRAVLRRSRVASQSTTYWCGPTTMQMIAWGWSGRRQSQQTWANRLGTTTSGSAITEMVRVTNDYTGWDKASYAGRYVALDISNYNYETWMRLNMRHYVDYKAPVILHPILSKVYYPYLDDDASGHFQTGRGYDKRGKRVNHLSYFEPWNQQRFDPSEPYIARVQWRNAYKSFRANKAHFQQNIGV